MIETNMGKENNDKDKKVVKVKVVGDFGDIKVVRVVPRVELNTPIEVALTTAELNTPIEVALTTVDGFIHDTNGFNATMLVNQNHRRRLPIYRKTMKTSYDLKQFYLVDLLFDKVTSIEDKYDSETGEVTSSINIQGNGNTVIIINNGSGGTGNTGSPGDPGDPEEPGGPSGPNDSDKLQELIRESTEQIVCMSDQHQKEVGLGAIKKIEDIHNSEESKTVKWKKLKRVWNTIKKHEGLITILLQIFLFVIKMLTGIDL